MMAVLMFLLFAVIHVQSDTMFSVTNVRRDQEVQAYAWLFDIDHDNEDVLELGDMI